MYLRFNIPIGSEGTYTVTISPKDTIFSSLSNWIMGCDLLHNNGQLKQYNKTVGLKFPYITTTPDTIYPSGTLKFVTPHLTAGEHFMRVSTALMKLKAAGDYRVDKYGPEPISVLVEGP